MSTPKIVITTTLTTLIVVAFTAVFASGLMPGQASAHGSFGGGHFRGAGRHGGDLTDRCERLGRDHSKLASAIASSYLDLDAAQETALEPLLAIGNRWREDTQALCLQLAGTDEHSVDQGLATMEAFLGRSATAAGELRSAWQDFEGQLTPAQQATITQMLSRHHADG